MEILKLKFGRRFLNLATIWRQDIWEGAWPEP
jgi:hypothetical protein